MQIYEELKARGLIAQVTDEEEIRELVNAYKATFYIGFDPPRRTASTLGTSWPLCLMKRLQMAREPPCGPGGRRHRLHRRPLRPHGYAFHDDPRDHPAQL